MIFFQFKCKSVNKVEGIFSHISEVKHMNRRATVIRPFRKQFSMCEDSSLRQVAKIVKNVLFGFVENFVSCILCSEIQINIFESYFPQHSFF